MKFTYRHALSAGLLLAPLAAGLVFLATTHAQNSGKSAPVMRGQSSLNDWSNERPGNRYLIKTSDMPKPYATESTANQSHIVPRPENAWPKVPEGFRIDQAATGLDGPRTIVTAPNGDLFVAESNPGRIRVLRGFASDGKVETNEVFASNLTMPYGIAFYPPGPNPQYVYIGNTNSIVRFPYKNGDLKARGPAEIVVVSIPGGSRYGGGHWTRSLVFTPDGKKLFAGVGSRQNVGDDASETNRADVLEFNPDGSGQHIYAYGIRNASGLAINPRTGQLWAAVNERDALGDDLVPDYVSHIQQGGFYGWPWYYLGPNQDPRFAGKRPDLKDKVIVPDVLLQSHSAPLALAFYEGKQFPTEYRGDAFVTSHGSWNRAKRTGYKVVRVFTPNGKATGEYEDFVTGFVVNDTNVWGRPVGITVARDGALVFTDDASNSVWRVTYTGGKSAAQ
ncbi:MAG TPA: sorbosone dehydrogenase family protein [Candidatus Dormibacteraeota bacterium]|nr:sorbosone dehydrogenase family protein [Candidatus Dormibacteraeota bacterium]